MGGVDPSSAAATTVATAGAAGEAVGHTAAGG
jgi:hypothetical protein